MTRRSIVAGISFFVHAIVFIALATADLWRPIREWPAPRRALAFDGLPLPIHLNDVEPPRRERTAPDTTTISRTGAAPITPPPEIGTEVELPGFSIEPEPRGDFGLGGPGVPSPPPAPPAAIPAPAPQQTPIRLHSGIRAPQRVVNVTPAYPAIARSAHVEGLVIIETTIDEYGNVVRTQLLRSVPLLDEAALAAVRQWKFSPTLLNGIAVPIVMTVTVNFTLK